MSHSAHIYGSDEDRFWPKVDRRGDDECWPWTAARLPSGYGRFKEDSGRVVYAHRKAYELVVGPIPDGMQIDHVLARGCMSKSCVNPAHLEVVTPGENTRRWSATITHCPRGHSYTEHGYLHPRRRAGRKCRVCAAAGLRAARARAREAA